MPDGKWGYRKVGGTGEHAHPVPGSRGVRAVSEMPFAEFNWEQSVFARARTGPMG